LEEFYGKKKTGLGRLRPSLNIGMQLKSGEPWRWRTEISVKVLKKTFLRFSVPTFTTFFQSFWF
jgi:hypothetical protein